MSRNSKKTNNLAFSLIEILISISLIMIMSTVFLANFHLGKDESHLNIEIQKLAARLRSAQNNALALIGFEEVGGGWGFYFDDVFPNQYIIFFDENGNYDYDLGEDQFNDQTKIVQLPEGLEIDKFVINGIEESGELKIIFQPPDPITYINDSSNSIVKIFLKGNTDDSIKIIEVNFFGLVDIIQ